MNDARPGRGVRTLPPLAALVLLALLATPLSAAHAVLQTATPPPNGRAEIGTTLVEFVFTEEVERDYTGAEVFDFNGDPVSAGPWTYGSDRNVLRLPVQPLQDGIYSARWQALSVDSHTTRGGFLFSVGNATLKSVGTTEAHDHSEHSQADVNRDGVARAVFYGGLFLVLGIPLFVLAVERRGTLPRSLLGTAALFGALGTAAALLGLLFLAERTSLPLRIAAGTEAGGSFVWRAAFLGAASLACLAALLLPPAKRRAPVSLAVALGTLALLATSMGSHAAADKDLTFLSIALDAMHLAMAAVWIGGVVAFLHVVWGKSPRELGDLVHRFTPLAVASVVVLLATGTYASLRHIPRVSALWDDPYGRLVSMKVILLLGLVGIGAYNKEVMGPRLREGTGSPRFFRRVLQAEAVLMVLILGAAGILASTPPPDREVQAGTQGPAAHLEFQNLTSHSHVIVQVSPNPVQVGIQRVIVYLHPGPDGAPVTRDATVALKIAAPGEREPDTTVEGLERPLVDQWAIEGGLFTSPGTWTLHVLVQRPDVGEFTKLAFEIPVEAPGAPQDPTPATAS